MDRRTQDIIFIVVGIVTTILLVVILTLTNNKTDEPAVEGGDIVENEEVIPPIIDPILPNGDEIVIVPSEDGQDENIENDEPPIGKDNVDLDVSENMPPDKESDPSASAGDVIYDTKSD